MNPYMRLIAFDFRLYFRDWITIFWILIYPILMLLIFGSMFGSQEDVVTGVRYIETYVPALCVMNVLSVSVFTLNINMITQRENGILRRYRVSPIRKSMVLASHAVQGVFLILVGAIEIIITAKIVWNIDITISGLLTLFACMLFGCLSFFSLGFAMSGLTRTAGAASGLAMAVFFPMLFLSGISMPISSFPSFMQTISKWLPMTYFVELAQGVWQGTAITEFGIELIVLAGFAVICCILALLLFRWEK
ncbi:MAG: ABC transporter permease [Candidatus Pristimantibacillus sp.]